MDMQFYPTPLDLAQRAWSKFKDRNFVRILEPSAGEGHLIGAVPVDRFGYHRNKIDAIELDATKHPVLKEKADVVGFDFLRFEAGAIYSHIIMNPPFAEGAKHVLKAWDILFDGEIVAILNAETLRNPYSKERQMLVRLIAQHGEVEFIPDAFKGDEVERQAEVEVALVYLRKQADTSAIIGDILGEMKADTEAHSLGADFHEAHDLALPNNFAENTVLAFKAAVEAMRQEVYAEARASHYAKLLGETMAKVNGDASGESSGESSGSTATWVRGELGKRYGKLKDRAWTGILRSTQVTSRLSSRAQSRLEAEFENIKKLEFSESNIYGFLAGLANAGGQIQIEMACDVFDLITKYHSDNTVFYMGWKSNDRHRTCGMRIKTTRFIIPGNPTDGWRSSLDWEGTQMLRDYDKVFAMLDGKREPDVSLEWVFRFKFNELRWGHRLSTSYFDVRFYPGVGTIHFFPRDKKLVDRLNRLVGRHRQWLPPTDEGVSKDFWLQFDKAEKFDGEIRKEFAKSRQGRSTWSGPSLQALFNDNDRKAESEEVLAQAVQVVLERHGINIEAAIEQHDSGRPLLLAA